MSVPLIMLPSQVSSPRPVPSFDELLPARAIRASWTDAFYFLGTFLFIYCQVFQFPFIPIYHENDSLIAVSNAIRMLEREVMYRDFFHITPPGAELIYAALFSLFGVKVWILNLVILFLGVAQLLVIWLISRRVMSGVYVYLPGALYLVVGHRLFGIDGSSRLFSIVFGLLAVAVLMNNRSIRNLVVAGAMCGFASFFIHPRGIVVIAGISFFLVWENIGAGFSLRKLLRSGFALGLPFLIVIVISQSYFAWQAGFDTFYFSLVTFPAANYPSDPLNTYRAYLSDLPRLGEYLTIYSPASAIFNLVKETGQKLFYYLLIPLIYFVGLIYLRFSPARRSFEAVKPRLILVCAVGIFLAAGVSAPTAPRIYHIAIPGLIVFVWLLTQIPASTRIATGLMAILTVAGAAYSIQRQVVSKCYIDMPSGTAAFLAPAVCDKYRWLQQHTMPGDALYEGYHPSFYYPLHLRNPTPLNLTRDSNYTPQTQVDLVVKSLEKDPPTYIIWPRRWSKPDEDRQSGDNLGTLWNFVRDNYQKVHTFSDIASTTEARENDMEVWEKKQTP